MADGDPDLDQSCFDLERVLKSGDPNLQIGYLRSLGFDPFHRDRAVDLGVRFDLDPVVVDHLSGV